MKQLTLVLATVTISLFHVERTLAQWEITTGLEGGYMSDLVVHDGSLYVGTTNGGGLYKSDDHGLTWDVFADSLFNATTIQSLASYEDTLYVNAGRLYRMYKGSWKMIYSGQLNYGLNENVEITAKHILIADDDNKLYISPDRGITWTLVEFFEDKTVGRIASFKDRMYVATQDVLYYSDDMQTWNSQAWTADDHGALRMMEAHNDKLYFATNTALYTTDLVGQNLTVLTSSLPDDLIYELFLDSDDIYLGTGRGVYGSSDIGNTWSRGNYEPTLIRSLFSFSIVRSGDRLIATSQDGIHSRPVNEDTWRFSHSGITHRQTRELLYYSDQLFVGADDDLLVSSDGAESWIEVASDVGGTITALAANGDYLYIGYGRGTHVYFWNGSKWEYSTNNIDNKAVFDLTPIVGGMVAATEDGILVTEDNGASWAARNNGLTDKYINTVIAKGDSLLVGSSKDGVSLSTDNGVNWTRLNDGLEHIQAEKLFVNGSDIYVFLSDDDFFYRFDHENKKWTSAGPGFGGPVSSMIVLGDQLLGASWASAVQIFDEDKKEWNEADFELKDNIYSVVAIGDHVYGASSAYGVLKLSKKWLEPLLEAPSVFQVENITDQSADALWGPVGFASSYNIDVSDDHFTSFLSGYENREISDFNFEITGLNPATEYQYRIRGENPNSTSPNSNVVTFTTLDVLPLAPNQLVSTITVDKQIELSWNDNSDNETSFKLERAPNGGVDFVALAEVGANVTNYLDTDVTTDQTYTYRVKANNVIGDSDFSNEEAISIVSEPEVPTVTSITEAKTVSYFPNPVTNWLTLTFDDSKMENREISIYSLTGIRLLTNDIRTSTNQVQRLDMSALPSGIYLLKTNTNNSQTIDRVVKIGY
ncbi:MAG: T9SS type A sorting domain-containing protein [Reichenbachiella sp.]|uniref:T9SS type A sorting domain-containing protein n=1 Tax=Reichenbachiella sp. TaxID=2184521 RepID=UPI003266B1E6